VCGRYARSEDLAGLVERFACVPAEGLDPTPRYNQAPGQEALVVLAGETGRELAGLRWGLVPSWAADPRGGYKLINARAEGLADKPAFRAPLRRQRCLAPASGFYEWQRTGKQRQPWFIALAGGGTLALAGLWDRWRGADGRELRSFCIVTVPANALVGRLHDRMPAILAPEDEAAWLDPERHDPADLLPRLRPYPAQALTAHLVSPAVNRVTVEGPELIRPWRPHGLFPPA